MSAFEVKPDSWIRGLSVGPDVCSARQRRKITSATRAPHRVCLVSQSGQGLVRIDYRRVLVSPVMGKARTSAFQVHERHSSITENPPARSTMSQMGLGRVKNTVSGTIDWAAPASGRIRGHQRLDPDHVYDPRQLQVRPRGPSRQPPSETSDEQKLCAITVSRDGKLRRISALRLPGSTRL